jgi:Bacterial Ig-like domain (group 3)
MCHEYASPNWHRRRPDNTGSYLNGTWDTPSISPMPNGTDSSNVGGLTCTPCAYGPTYFASQVLPDGRVIVIGGEYNAQDGNTVVDTDIGFLYDPATDSWSTQLSEPFGANVGDASSAILESGNMLLANINGTGLAALNCSLTGGVFDCLSNPPVFGTLSTTNSKTDGNDEEGYINLPNNKFLVVDANVQNSSEIFDASTNTWNPPVATAGISLTDLGNPTLGTGCNSHEVGPGVTRADGTIVYFSGSTFGQNAVYDIATGVWSHPANVDFPVLSGAQYGAADAPASLLPDGHVLIMSSPVTCNGPNAKGKYSIFNSPSHFFEWDGSNLTQVADSANAGNFDSYQGRMLLLPTGEVLLTAFDQSSNDAQQLYRNTNPQLTSVGPVITSFPPAVLGLGSTYTVGGNQFNGFSLGAFYGDDSQSSTNYPLVRITDSAGHVFYAKTHDHSRMGVEAVGDSTTVTTTNFDVPTGLATGGASLVVVTNSFPSAPYSIDIEPGSTLTLSGATSADYSDPATVSATLTATVGGTSLPGKTVTFVLGNGGGNETCVATTNGAGVASCSITPNQIPGPYTLNATFAGDSSYGASSASEAFTILKEDTAISITGPTTADYDDAVTVVAQLTDPTGGAPIAGKSLTFVLGSGAGTETCTATTNASGNASCSITPNQASGSYSLKSSFSGDAFYLASSASVTFTITKEEDTLAFTSGSATVIANGHSATLSAILKEDGVTPISGRTVSITLGTGATAQTCSGTTDATGTAACSILVNQPLGPNTVTANFAGDPFYLPSSASEPVILFAFLASGSMIVGNLDAAVGTNVEFWGAQWANLNSLTGGAAPNAFKGFADTAPQSCGGGWTSSPGNSSGPPATVPSYMGVIASSSVLKSGSAISGDVPIIIVVRTQTGYGPSPGHAGTGTVVAVFCH